MPTPHIPRRPHPDPADRFEDIPEAMQRRLVHLAAAFHVRTRAPIADIQRFMVETIQTYVAYMEGGEPRR